MTQDSDTPADETTQSDSDPLDLEFGQTLYTEDGRPVGLVQGIDESRVVLSIDEDVDVTDLERHHRSGQSFGEAELMWRCTNCGEMGEIEEGLPDTCPTCGTEKEDLMYWTED